MTILSQQTDKQRMHFQLMNMPENPWFADTHKVINQPKPLENYNLFDTDIALKEAIEREGASWAAEDLHYFGEKIGTDTYIELGFQANENKPQLHTHDRYGRRIDLVKFHPAYHQLMRTAIEHGLHASPWTDPKPGAHVARAAHCYLHNQIEAAHGCPITMTFAAIPSLRHTTSLLDKWAPLITARHYDPSNVPANQKQGVTIGMAMTEKQGGSDVRANTTRAYPIGKEGSGELYELVGHKFFVSAPMCDAFLVLAQTTGGLSCFLVPRWREDGTKNPLQIIRLKNKMGNVANASSETELRGAHGWMVGEEGRGVATIIEMVSLTRFDCMVGSSSGMRQAIAQAIHHCKERAAFGAKLSDQPLMQNVLADLVLEQEAALALSMRMARALDNQHIESEKQFMRLGTAVGKYWICKRTPNHAYEAMECIGGSGVMEDSMMPRLFRESPVNAIWEGSGNVQCLDVLRAVAKTPVVIDTFFTEMALAKGEHKIFDRFLSQLQQDTSNLLKQDRSAIEFGARQWVDKLAIGIQASLLIRAGNSLISDAYCASRLSESTYYQYGCLNHGVNATGIIQRALP